MQSIQVVSDEWNESLARLVSEARSMLLVCSPYVSEEGVHYLTRHLHQELIHGGNLMFMTNLSVMNVCQLSTDPRAIYSLATCINSSRVVHLPGLHAKVYIADESSAIVTSGNLTASGLYRNKEYGVEIKERQLVGQIRSDLQEFSTLGAAVPIDKLWRYCEAIERLRSVFDHEFRAARSNLRGRFRAEIEPLEDDLLRLRLAEGPINTVFAGTIEYLLRSRGPLTTTDLHPLVAAIHPDLCDQSVDRVIDGKSFGKKWKHAVRSAQQRLKQQGRIAYVNGRWSLSGG